MVINSIASPTTQQPRRCDVIHSTADDKFGFCGAPINIAFLTPIPPEPSPTSNPIRRSGISATVAITIPALYFSTDVWINAAEGGDCNTPGTTSDVGNPEPNHHRYLPTTKLHRHGCRGRHEEGVLVSSNDLALPDGATSVGPASATSQANSARAARAPASMPPRHRPPSGTIASDDVPQRRRAGSAISSGAARQEAGQTVTVDAWQRQLQRNDGSATRQTEASASRPAI